MPSRTELDEAMMAPQTRLIPTNLKGGRAEVVRFGSSYVVPWAWGGSFAVVYKFRLPGDKIVALRCFLTDVAPSVALRYQRLGELLASQASKFTVRFRYHERGIRVRGPGGKLAEYPILEIAWVEGYTVLEEVDRLCQGADSAGLAKLAEKWVNLVLAMKRIRMAHGCLCGNDVLVRPDGSLVLIDYDGVYFLDPAITAHPPNECGHHAYERPDHHRRPYDERMDDFSALVIYLAVLALTERPQLFRQFVLSDAKGQIVGDNLLFTARDFEAPDSSTVFSELAKSRGFEVRQLTDVLKKACTDSPRQVPCFETLVDPSPSRGRQRHDDP